MQFYRCSLAMTVMREKLMRRSSIHRQQQLFDEAPSTSVVVLPTFNREEVVQLLSKLLGEVAHTCADHANSAEVDDDQD